VRSQPFTKNHFHFLSVLESVISGVLLQQPKQVKVDCRVDGPEVPSEITAATLVSGLLYVRLHCHAKYHTMDTLFVWDTEATLKADSHIACHAHAVPLPYRAAKV
jgi:hypothetical protein